MTGHRSLIVLAGTPEETAAGALACIADLDPDTDVVWISASDAPAPLRATAPARTRGVLGTSITAAVVDLHGRVDPEAIGRVEGAIRGGGALVLRMDPHERPDTEATASGRFERRFRAALVRARTARPRVLTRADVPSAGSDEQSGVVDALVAFVAGPPGQAVLTADRGRGKSAALGMAVARLPGDAAAVVTGPSPEACAEVVRFAGPALQFVPAHALALHPTAADVIVVDEAAQLPVPVLRRIVARHATARIAFATTVHGYEGTGRGFAIRFVDGLRDAGTVRLEATLAAPIRWAPNDPVEAFVRDALLLNAEPDPAPANPTGAPVHVACEQLDRDRLVDDEPTLRAVFGLLVQAHYRTTPSDLRHLLDAPGVHVHVARAGRSVVGATLVAEEGDLPERVVDDLLHGRGSVRGHALAETLVSHLGHADAGRMRLVRSVRIATHPAVRRQGVARRLVEHVHATYRPDAFGTIHGATADLLQFRRALGYELIRVSASRGSRTGEPSVTMVRPCSERASQLAGRLREELARDLPAQLRLFETGDELLLDPALVGALRAGLPAATPGPWRRDRMVAYAFGPRTFESVVVDVRAFVLEQAALLDVLDACDRALLESRVIRGDSWARTMAAAGADSLPATMRGLRRAVRALWEAAGARDAAAR